MTQANSIPAITVRLFLAAALKTKSCIFWTQDQALVVPDFLAVINLD